MTALAYAEIEGERISRSAQVETCRSLLVAGNETTRNALSAEVIALAEHSGEWSRVVADRTRSRTAADEILRSTSVILHMVRSATDDTVIAD